MLFVISHSEIYVLFSFSEYGEMDQGAPMDTAESAKVSQIKMLNPPCPLTFLLELQGLFLPSRIEAKIWYLKKPRNTIAKRKTNKHVNGES